MQEHRFVLGRSMIEMLAVLAIIAILSIGGFLGFKQAKTSLQMARIKSFISEVDFAFKENCYFAEKNECLASAPENTLKIARVLCLFVDDNFCPNKRQASIASLPNILFYPAINSDQVWSITMRGLNKSLCSSIFNTHWPHLNGIVASDFYYDASKPFPKGEKERGIARCTLDSFSTLRFFIK